MLQNYLAWFLFFKYKKITWPSPPNFSGRPARNWMVRLGEINLTSTSSSRVDVPVARIFQHERYSPSPPFFNDISVMELSRSVAFNSFVRPICLPTRSFVVEGKPVVAAGWGRTGAQITAENSNILLEVDLSAFVTAKCNNFHSNLNHEKQFCAGSDGPGKDTCSVSGPFISPFLRDIVWFDDFESLMFPGRFRWSVDVSAGYGRLDPGWYYVVRSETLWLHWQARCLYQGCRFSGLAVKKKHCNTRRSQSMIVFASHGFRCEES